MHQELCHHITLVLLFIHVEHLGDTSGYRFSTLMIREHVVPLAKHQMGYRLTHDDTLLVVSRPVSWIIDRHTHHMQCIKW